MASNPVINKFGQAPRATTPDLSTNDLNAMYSAPAYTGPRGATRYMTLDDVVQRTGAMLLMVLAVGAVSWSLADTSAAVPIALVGALGGFGLAIYMSFAFKANAALALTYAAFEGAFLGAISRVFNDRFHGIVIQAVTGTVAVAVGMLFVYRSGAIRVTPRFTKVLIGGLIGVVGLSLVNAIAYLFHPGGLGLRSGGGLAIVFSIVCIGLAAMSLIADFDLVERGIRAGTDEKFAWFAAFGLTVTLVWLYTEILRLLSYLRQ